MKYKLDTKRIKPQIVKTGSFGRKRFLGISKFFKNLFAAALLIVIAIFIFPTDVPKRLESKIDEMLIKLDLRVLNIMITGIDKLESEKVIEASGLNIGDNIFLVKLSETKDLIEKMTWVKNATITRSLPNTILIDIEEERPEALYIVGDSRYLISASGKLLTKVNTDEEASGYIITKGKNANFGFREIVSLVQKHNVLYSQLEGVEKISNRRWNLILSSGCVVQLPEEGIAEALEAFEKNSNQNKILSLPTVVDLRLAPDKIFLRLSK